MARQSWRTDTQRSLEGATNMGGVSMGKDARVSGGFTEKLRAKISPGHQSLGRLLDRLPPLGVESHLLVQPIAHELLTGLLAPAELTEAVSELCLGGPGKLDGPLKSSDVTGIGFCHRPGEYTNGFVPVNNPICENHNPACVTPNKSVCNIVNLATIRAEKVAKSAVKLKTAPRKKKTAIPGIDGRTVPQRIREAMIYHAGAMRMREYRQADLVREVNELYGHEILSQQNMSAIMISSSYSNFIPLIAKACGVSAVWLAYGLGPMVECKSSG